MNTLSESERIKAIALDNSIALLDDVLEFEGSVWHYQDCILHFERIAINEVKVIVEKKHGEDDSLYTLEQNTQFKLNPIQFRQIYNWLIEEDFSNKGLDLYENLISKVKSEGVTNLIFVKRELVGEQ